MATVVVQTDAPCALSMNGDNLGKVVAGINKVRVSPGQKLVSCISSEEKVSFEGELEARSGQDTVLRISLASRVEDARSVRAAADERAAQEKREAQELAQREEREARERPERERREAQGRVRREEREAKERQRAEAERRAACERGEPSLMEPTSDGGVLRQCGTDLLWTRSDNGSDVQWSQAQAHCRGLGVGWSLPTVAQLKSLDNWELQGVPCGGGTCKVSDQFRLSNDYFWSSESNGSSQDKSGIIARLSTVGSGHFRGRALCVRRP
jgi:hypothetical protein